MGRKFTKFPSSYVVASNNATKVTNKLRRDIYEYCDALNGYGDYDQKIEDVMEEFGLTKEQAEIEVWNWSINQ